MKKTERILRLIAYYILLFVFSSISFNSIPIGGIALIAATYAAGAILGPAIILISLSSIIFVGIKSVLVLIMFLILFLVPVIFVRPLVSIEGRNEKKKVGNYLIFAGFFSFVFFGFLNGIYSLILTYLLYKIFVNIMAVLKNDDEKIVFAKEENIGLATMLSIGVLYVSTYFNINILISIITIAIILGYFSIKKGLAEGVISYILIIFIYFFILTPLMNTNLLIDKIFSFNNIILIILPIIVLSLISILRRFSRIIIYYSISVMSIILFYIFYKYFENLTYYLPYLFMTITVLIFATDYASLNDKKIVDSGLISDEGETRLETEGYYNEKKENEKKKEKLKSREIIELFGDKDIFVDRMYVNEDMYKDLALYDEIQASDYIIEEIYYLIKDDGYINRKKFQNILNKHNVIIDIYSYEMEEEIRILEMLALRELKGIVREREEKKIILEREEFKNIEKEAKTVEEKKSIAYNEGVRNSNKKQSIRNLNFDKINLYNDLDDDIDDEIIINSKKDD